MILFHKENSYERIPTRALKEFNIIGAGDMVVAALSIALAHDSQSDHALYEACQIANYAAGAKVETPGTTPITIGDLISKMKK